jgi:hypothetical protein
MTTDPIRTVQAQQAKTGLAAKVGLKREREDVAGTAGDGQLLEAISTALLAEDFAQILAAELPYHQYGGVFLQTVLLAQQGNA